MVYQLPISFFFKLHDTEMQIFRAFQTVPYLVSVMCLGESVIQFLGKGPSIAFFLICCFTYNISIVVIHGEKQSLLTEGTSKS